MPSHLGRIPGNTSPESLSGGTYLRDGRAPTPARESTSRVMSANRATNTGPELALRQALFRAGIRGYRVSPSGVPGRPDLVFRRERLVVFVHGCFWHRCPHCRLPLPKTHTEWWRTKFARNRARDRAKAGALGSGGWHVLTLWECEISASAKRCARRVERGLKVVSPRGRPFLQGERPPAR